MRFVDSHLHIDQVADLASTLVQAVRTRTLLISCGIDRASSMKTMELARTSPGNVKAFVGIHPSEVGDGTSTEWLESLVKEADGVGEIGLDPKYSECGPSSPQMKVFEAQLELAKRHFKPVEVHSRGAEKECLDALGTFDLNKVLMHWFQGEGLLGRVQAKMMFVSFGPALIQSKKLQRMAASLERTLILTETDAPVRFSSLGGPQGPFLLPSVVFKLAEVWGTPFEEAREQVVANSLAFSGSGEKG